MVDKQKSQLNRKNWLNGKNWLNRKWLNGNIG